MRESVPSGVLPSVLRPAFIAASIAWAALLVVAPWFAAQAHAAPIEGAFLFTVYAVGGGICHQRPERSFFLWAEQMPVCARCAGIYFGAATAVIVAMVMAHFNGRPTTERHPTTAGAAAVARAILIAAALPAAFSLLNEWTPGQMPSHWARAATGLPIGGAVAWLVLAALRTEARAADQVN